jgi:CDP-glycerol glycerophosphotransferase (TagB/SpsB family)
VQIFHGCSLKNRAVHEDALAYDKLFLVGPYMKQKFVTTWNLKDDDPRFEEIGMPKLDAFFDGSLNKKAILEKLELDPALPIVIYAPTRPTPTSSSLSMYGPETIDTIAQMPVNFLVKLHDRSFRKWRPKGKIDWEEWLKKYEGHRRVRVVHDYDVVPYLYASDLLVSDISSVVNEFSLLNRPMVLFAVPRLIAFHKKVEAKRGLESSDLEDWGQDVGTTVQKPDELQRAIDYSLGHAAEKEAVRKKFAQQFFFNPGQATEKALQKIYALLALSTP